MSAISQQALAMALPVFALDSKSNIHGVPHWARVARNGRMLARATQGASEAIAEWFAYFHDSCRLDDNADPQHGRRAADFVERLWLAGRIDLAEREVLDLQYALENHSAGLMDDPSPSVLVCWDADRLDLLRVGVWPEPRRMCTLAGRQAANTLRKEFRRSF